MISSSTSPDSVCFPCSKNLDMTSIAMGFFAANMERKLRLLFAPECGWALDYDFDLGEVVIFPRFPDVPAIQ